MENKIKTEEFDSTEIKIEEIESDVSDDWEFMSKHEADRKSVPRVSVPKMREFIEESDSTSYRIGIDSDRGSEQAVFSKHVQESERGTKDEDKQEQLPHHKQCKESEKFKKKEEMVQTISFQHDQEKRLQKDMEEAMQESFQCEKEDERVRREMVEAMQDLNQNDPEKDRLKRELHEARQILYQNEQENDRFRRELRELKQTLHKKEKEIDGLRRELHEAILDAAQNEQENDRFRRELRELKQTLHQKEKEIDGLRRELHEAILDAAQNEQGNYRDKRKMDEAMQDKEFTSRAAECSKSQIHATEGKSLAKGKDESKIPVFSHALSEAFQKFFKVNTSQSTKVSTDAAETDELVKAKYVELSPEQLEFFRKAGIEIASSSDEESKE